MNTGGLTRDEMTVLKECQVESFWRRCIPITTVLVLGVHYLTSIKVLSSTGYGVKMLTSIVTGYTVGKLSYAKTCRLKILSQIPESKLAKALNGEQHDSLNFVQNYSQPPEIYSNRNQFEPENETLFVSNDNKDDDGIKAVTYEDLKNQHRSMFAINNSAKSFSQQSSDKEIKQEDPYWHG
ncbi:hypothetical protein GJ496_010968 [Pomphorhynchus laevis]|nr:hypothetical protein GJ496_010968 [Pomphorhynchus laevis]